jgi:hypothetical protein
MKVHCQHTNDAFLASGLRPVGSDDVPTMQFGVRFLLRDNKLTGSSNYYGLVDTGAEITAMPLWLLGDWATMPPPAHYAAPDTVVLRGLHSSRRVAAYPAQLSIGGKPLAGVFPVAAVPALAYPIIGRDVLNHFHTVIDPFSRPKRTVLVDRHQRTRPLRWLIAMTSGRDVGLADQCANKT